MPPDVSVSAFGAPTVGVAVTVGAAGFVSARAFARVGNEKFAFRVVPLIWSVWVPPMRFTFAGVE